MRSTNGHRTGAKIMRPDIRGKNPAALRATTPSPVPGREQPLPMVHSSVNSQGRLGKEKRKPIYMRRVTSTAFQMAIDHTFTGTYVTRFTSRRTRDARVAPPPAPPNTSPTNATASPGSGLHQASITSPPTTPVGFLPKTLYSTLHAIS